MKFLPWIRCVRSVFFPKFHLDPCLFKPPWFLPSNEKLNFRSVPHDFYFWQVQLPARYAVSSGGSGDHREGSEARPPRDLHPRLHQTLHVCPQTFPSRRQRCRTRLHEHRLGSKRLLRILKADPGKKKIIISIPHAGQFNFCYRKLSVFTIHYVVILINVWKHLEMIHWCWHRTRYKLVGKIEYKRIITQFIFISL